MNQTPNGVDRIFAEYFGKHKLKKTMELKEREWREGELVICKTREQTFEAEIVGFNENSAVVYHLTERRPFCVSLRNIYDPATLKPLKHTKRFDHVSATNRWLTAYIPTEEERKNWPWK